jgi:hypothetical protein
MALCQLLRNTLHRPQNPLHPPSFRLLKPSLRTYPARLMRMHSIDGIPS